MLDWTIIYFRDFWALVEKRQEKETEPEQILLRFSEFWATVAISKGNAGEDSGPGVDDLDFESGPDSDSDDETSSDDEFLSLQHFANMYILEADQRYLLRTLEINDYILRDQERRLEESKKATKALEAQRSRLAKLRRKMETVRNHKILGSFTQFWQHIEEQAENEESDHLGDVGDFFRLVRKSYVPDQ